jgi:F420-dependent oxidoreductase-like protein
MKYAKLIIALLLWLLPGTSFAQSSQAQPPIRFGILTPGWNTSWQDLRTVWQQAEQLGFDSAWVPDHVLAISGAETGPALDSWMLLAALAGETSRMRIGCLVTANTFRYPAVLAKMATTVDHLSNGRLALGLGAAWHEREHQAYGIPFYTAKERAERLGEAAALIRLLWSEEPANFQGKYYQLDNAPFAPRPVQKPHPPIVIGGAGPKWTLPIVARFADIWNVGYTSPKAVADLNQVIDRHCQDIGRDPKEIERSLFARLALTTEPVDPSQEDSRTMRGTPKQIVEQLQQFREAGITHFIFGVYPELGDPQTTLRILANEVMPAFR